MKHVLSLLPVVFGLLSSPEQLLDVLGHLFSFQYYILCTRQGGVRFSYLPASTLLGLPAAFLLTAAAQASEKNQGPL